MNAQRATRGYGRLACQVLMMAGLLFNLGTVTAADVVTYYHTDGLGTPVMESDAGGQVTYSREHRPYGAQALGASKHGPGFTGHVGDADSGLIYMQARYYDPVAGRFVSTDPVMANPSTGAMFNRYAYGLDNPYTYTDPDGRVPRGYSNLCAMWCDSSYVAGESGSRSVDSATTEPNEPAKPPAPPSVMPKPVEDAIEAAGRRIAKLENPKMIEAWNKTIWKWDPENKQFKLDPNVAAFVDKTVPNTIFVGTKILEFTNTHMKFTYQQASFKGGVTAMLFVALHEFAHIWTAGIGRAGTPEREQLANAQAFKWLPRISRSEVKCVGCIE